MYTTEYSSSSENNYRFIIDELGKILPNEIICNEFFVRNKKSINIIKNKINPFFNIYDNLKGIDESKKNNILELFNVKSLDELKLVNKMYSIISTSKLIEYLYTTQKTH